MKVLVIGSGGREHAICYALHKSQKVDEIHAIPGNPGIAQIGTCHPGSVEDIPGTLKFVQDHGIDFIVIGPENPLCLGMADALRAAGYPVFGPNQAAAALEGSKAFSKEFMVRHHIPTAAYQEVHHFDEAVAALDHFQYPVVIKADGLAAGKGVVIAQDRDMAVSTLDQMMRHHSMGDAGNTIVLEEFLEGFECSLLCFTDGKTIVPMVSAKDHKQVYDGNKGPNTGGMGTVSPNPFLPQGIETQLHDRILQPFLNGLQEDHLDYRGVIFIGLMIDPHQNAKVLEFNVRFGDPETQSILMRLDSDLFEVMMAVAEQKLDQVEINWKPETVACLVLASEGYPGSYPKGLEITGLDDVDSEIVIFHAGTKEENGKILTNGGRVLNLCAYGRDLDEARQKVYRAAEVVDFKGKYYRHDIGLI